MAERWHTPRLPIDGADLTASIAIATACAPAAVFGQQRAERDEHTETASAEKNGKNNGFVGGFRKQDRHGQDYRKQDQNHYDASGEEIEPSRIGPRTKDRLVIA